MAQKIRLGILGVGNMGSTIARGVVGAGILGEAPIHIFDVDPARVEALAGEPRVHACSSELELVQQSTMVILAVKPQVAAPVLEAITGAVTKDHALVSIMAGIPLNFLRARAPSAGGLVRVMPNTPMLVEEGMAAVAFEAGVSPAIREVTLEIFSALGRAVELDERYLDAVTGLSGSGPAYVLAFLEALADGGVKVGLPKTTALELAAQTILGTVKLYFEQGVHPGQLKDMVTSPGGTTIAGLHELERGGFRATVMNAVERATLRSKELGEALK